MAPSSDKSGPSLWIESPEVRVGSVARVAMVAAIEGEYSFAVPDTLADRLEPGKRLLVPFGRNRKPQPAFCVAVAREPWTSTLKPVADVLDESRLLGDELIELGQWMSRYYCCPLGRVLVAMVPEAIRKQSGFRTIKRLRLANRPAQVSRSAKRQAVVDALADEAQGLDLDVLIERTSVSKGVISAMVKAGLLAVETRREPAPAPDFDRPGDEPTFKLNADQQSAIERIGRITNEGKFRTVLLFGVSGSGKTEVYVRSIRKVLAAGKQAILLVPEIALTTQIVDRLASRFKDVAVVHSGLTGVQRSLTWAAIARGDKRVVIGTRSAVFAPCPDLGLIVVDEEQESSYKNQQSPRFHTRDVAIKRAQLASIPIVLGSATPSLETWHNCSRLEHFELVTLPNRITDLPMPAVEFVDMRIEQQQRKGMHLLSRTMEAYLREALSADQQAVLLLNRRGYASYLMCSRCRNPIVCPNCRVNMVFHQTTGKAMCHYCSARMVLPKRCGDASCGGTLIRWGMGTQRVEEEVRAKFPETRVARADSDTMTGVGRYEEVLRGFADRRIDVLVGTQMIAKGLDFPCVSFVGVVNADTTLAVPDFRAAERTFQLATQVAGRAGRSEAGGRVVVQNLAGESAALRFAAQHDYSSFAEHELAIRKRLGWPPFSRLARVLVSHRIQSEASQLTHRLADAIRQHLVDRSLPADVLGPQSAPLGRLRNQYRYDFLVRAANASRLMETLEVLRHEKVLTPSSRHVLIEVDPTSLL